MNPIAHPDVVAAEIAYRFERDRVSTPPVAPARDRHGFAHGLAQWLRRMIHRSSAAGSRQARSRRA